MVNVDQKLQRNPNDEESKNHNPNNNQKALENINGSSYQSIIPDSFCFTPQTSIDDRSSNVESGDVKENMFNAEKETGKGQCPIYYGIKSHIHHFYRPSDQNVPRNEDCNQEDDFRFLAEPRRKKNIDWFTRLGLWIGVNLMLIGTVSTLVGFLTPQENIIVGEEGGLAIVDRGAVTFNNHLMLCQISGLVSIASGAILVVCCLLVLNYQPRENPPSLYCVMLPPGQGWGLQPVPFYGTVRGVQPTLGCSHY